MSEKTTTPDDPNWPAQLEARLHRVGKATMEVTIELGRARVPLRQVLQAEPGRVFELDALHQEPVTIRVNGTVYGRGEIVVMGENMGVRVTDLSRPEAL